MHKVMLIDDDVPMLKVLQQMIDWETLKLQIAGATYSSAKALHMFQEIWPDIVITDIGLPQKNGIDLAASFMSLKPDTRIIFLTCHEDFGYAQAAIKLSADDYLLKDQLSQEQLERSLKKAIRELHTKGTAMTAERAKSNELLFRQDLIARVIEGVKLDSTVEYAAELGITWRHPYFMMAVVDIRYAAYEQIYTYSDLPLISYAIYNIALELTTAYEGITPFVQKNNLVILYNYRLNLANHTYLYFQQYMDELRSRCEHFLRIQLSTVTINDRIGLESIGICHRQYVKQKSGFYKNKSGNLVISDLSLDAEEVFYPASQGMFDTWKSELELAILKNDAEAIHQIVSSMKSIAQDKRIEPRDLVHEMTVVLRGVDLMFSRKKQDESMYSYLASAQSCHDVMELSQTLLLYTMRNRQQSTGLKTQEPKLQVIQEFIDNHLSENITSIDMARYLYLNSSYFSRYFKRLTGVNFTDYVHEYKMKIAAKMMKTSGQTLESLAIGLGYSDRTYFSKVFKKYVGMTPSEYKRKHYVS
ncbi:response regulator [Paenibacillus sp. Marseille-Q4541]|uniref:response regulator transcription factor n=1 Tax=Paenibacillus sp. Marseille-Q4541 TaxID=2831522 RepID=UPI001BA93885|nr:response regulator [Paenibacillus sp. Marseille-Q4541]